MADLFSKSYPVLLFSIYEIAKHWVQQYATTDEVKDYINKTQAIEEYARRANDHDMEIKAVKARVYDERRCGQLIKKMKKAKGTDYGGTGYDSRSSRLSFEPPKTLKQLEITKDQSSKYQKLANVPEKEFEDAINLPGTVPSAANRSTNELPITTNLGIAPTHTRDIRLCSPLQSAAENCTYAHAGHSNSHCR